MNAARVPLPAKPQETIRAHQTASRSSSPNLCDLRPRRAGDRLGGHAHLNGVNNEPPRAYPSPKCNESSFSWGYFTQGQWGAGSFCLGNGGARTVLQSDSNLVHYLNGRAVAASGTNGRGPLWITFQNDGNVVLYDSNNRAVWASGTNGPGRQSRTIVVQSDGNLVIYNTANPQRWVPMWATGTFWQNATLGHRAMRSPKLSTVSARVQTRGRVRRDC